MNHARSFSVTQSTTAATEVSTTLDVSRGILTRIGVYFPGAADDVVFIRAEYRGRQIFPANRGEYFNGDSLQLYVVDRLPILDPPYEIAFYGYNTGSSSACVVRVMATIIPEDKAGGSP
jgi:hypothetical protein